MKKLLLLVSVASFFIINGCGSPEPVVSSISPAGEVAHMPSFTLTVNGSDFEQDSKIVFNGQEKATTFVSSSELTCGIEPEDIIAGAAAKVNGNSSAAFETPVDVLVRTPSPGGGDSSALQFMVKSNHTYTLPEQIRPSLPTVAAEMKSAVNNVLYMQVYFFQANWKTIINLMISTDNGNTWNDPERITPQMIQWSGSDLQADQNGNVHSVYSNSYSIFYRRRDASSGWADPVKLSTDKPSVLYSQNPIISVFGDHIFVTAQQINSGYSFLTVLYYSGDNGISWTPARKIDPVGSGYVYSKLVLTSSNLLVLPWGANNEVWVSTSADLGASWSPRLMLSNGQQRSYGPSILYSGNGSQMSLVWVFGWGRGAIVRDNADQQRGHGYKDYLSREMIASRLGLPPDTAEPVSASLIPRLQISHSEDSGSSWTPAATFYKPGGDNQFLEALPFVAADSAGNYNIVFMSGPNFDQIRSKYFRSVDLGATWTTPVDLADWNVFPSGMAMSDSGRLFLTVAEWVSYPNIYYSYFLRSIHNN